MGPMNPGPWKHRDTLTQILQNPLIKEYALIHIEGH